MHTITYYYEQQLVAIAEARSFSAMFDSGLHPDNSLNTFSEFTNVMEFRYETTYQDTPKVSLDIATER